MTLSYLRTILFLLDLFAVVVQSTTLNISGEAITTRFWDCCKPSCSWEGKASVSQPVQSCDKDDNPTSDFSLGTGCNGGTGYLCSDQQPWAVNDTFAYGYAGVFIMGHVEDFWCCACYQLDFTSEPLKGKTMIVQASNTAYDMKKSNRFSLALPGGNTTDNTCANQFGVEQSVFGKTGSGVQSSDDCDDLPEQLRDACKFRFDWFEDALYPNVNFKRVVCPAELTDKTGCSRNDDQDLSKALAGISTGSSSSFSTSSWLIMTVAMITAGLLSV